MKFFPKKNNRRATFIIEIRVQDQNTLSLNPVQKADDPFLDWPNIAIVTVLPFPSNNEMLKVRTPLSLQKIAKCQRECFFNFT